MNIFSHVRAAIKYTIWHNFPSNEIKLITKYHHCKILKSLPEDYEDDFKGVKYLAGHGNIAVDIGADFGLTVRGRGSTFQLLKV